MARSTECHKVFFVVCPTFAYISGVVDKRCRGHPSFLDAQLTEGMLRQILLTDFPPLVAIALFRIRISFVALVSSCSEFCVLITVSPISEPWTARMGTWSLRFVWHDLSLGHKKNQEVSLALRCRFPLYCPKQPEL